MKAAVSATPSPASPLPAAATATPATMSALPDRAAPDRQEGDGDHRERSEAVAEHRERAGPATKSRWSWASGIESPVTGEVSGTAIATPTARPA